MDGTTLFERPSVLSPFNVFLFRVAWINYAGFAESPYFVGNISGDARRRSSPLKQNQTKLLMVKNLDCRVFCDDRY